ncbi:Exonuclease [Frankliniella fusca]|uniref:Exonuclease n=1 Tax=Frankliniella fusca TaxID=407009 RepID=A0AAE1HSJ1_9NEOP|nr:Exonuclease [Frankliniella fusca]
MKRVTDILEADLCRLDEISSYPQGGHQWLGARKIRLTASTFGPVVRRMKGRSCKKLERDMVHSKKSPTPAMKHGIDMEDTARRHFEQTYGRAVVQTGLVVHRDLPFLAASPDGLIGDDELLEIKCPTSGVDFKSAEEAVAGKKLNYLKLGSDGQFTWIGEVIISTKYKGNFI